MRRSNGLSVPKRIFIWCKLDCGSANSRRTTARVFHAQQCAEKYLKAFLVRHRIAFRKTHDLRDLRRQCVEVDSVFDLLTDALLLLNQFAIDSRYPGLALTHQDARDAVAAMKQVRAFVRARLGLKTK